MANQTTGEETTDGTGPLLIPKPPGENGRRNRGGYAVSEQVSYSSDVWEGIEVRSTYVIAYSYHKDAV